jgi:potassium channel subfamily K
VVYHTWYCTRPIPEPLRSDDGVLVLFLVSSGSSLAVDTLSRHSSMSAIDPGVEERIKQSADDVEENREREQEEQGDTHDAASARQPSRWWFASTACPLLAGTFGPIASGFNICSLVFEWRQYIPPGGTESTSEQSGQTLPDPAFEIGLNVASLFCALVGNASLLLNMAQRVKFSIAQPITVAGFLSAGVLLIVDLAVVSSLPNYGITRPEAIPHNRHAFTGAFYYAIFAASIYIVIGCLMLLTVYGANTGHYRKRFALTGPQRTLMLQTMSFVTYLLLGALVYSHIEGWEYLNAVYWADVTLLTVGLGEYSPSTTLGKWLLFPFAIGGILMIGLVVGSIRSLVLDRGKEKLSMRIVEKKRSKAIHNVDEHKQTIRISPFAHVDFNTDPSLSQAQRRREEFTAMRKVQAAGERERRWVGLLTSGAFALMLWFVGAAIFQQTEYTQQWSYLQSLYFSYTSLLTIGYGDFHPQSNSGKAFFVIWSLLAVPSLTILISNMGDTIVKTFSDITVSIGAVTVLPEEQGFRAGFITLAKRFLGWTQNIVSDITLPGLFGDIPRQPQNKEHPATFDHLLRGRLADRLAIHISRDIASIDDDSLDSDIKFYHYVLARECRIVQRDLSASPEKRYSWENWEYFLKLIGSEENPISYVKRPPSNKISSPSDSDGAQSLTVDSASRDVKSSDEKDGVETDGINTISNAQTERAHSHGRHDNANNQHGSDKQQAQQVRKNHRHEAHHSHADDFLRSWSWLSRDSPLLSSGSEAEWILDRLSAALERSLDTQRRGHRRQPPIGLHDLRKEKERESREDTVDAKQDFGSD